MIPVVGKHVFSDFYFISNAGFINRKSTLNKKIY